MCSLSYTTVFAQSMEEKLAVARDIQPALYRRQTWLWEHKGRQLQARQSKHLLGSTQPDPGSSSVQGPWAEGAAENTLKGIHHLVARAAFGLACGLACELSLFMDSWVLRT